MIRIVRYFENPFDDPEISGEELRSFAEDHRGKLEAQNSEGPLAGTFTVMIAATEAVFTPFDDALAARAQQIGALGGNTATKDQVLQLFRTTMRQRQGRVTDKFGEGSAQYKEIFPQGLSYYTRATMANIKERLAYAVEKVTKFQAQLGADLVTELTGLQTSFNSARDAQVGDKGSVSQARGSVASTRRALELQLTDNLLALARQFKGQPAKAAEFFDQSQLENPTPNKPASPPPTP